MGSGHTRQVKYKPERSTVVRSSPSEFLDIECSQKNIDEKFGKEDIVMHMKNILVKRENTKLKGKMHANWIEKRPGNAVNVFL